MIKCFHPYILKEYGDLFRFMTTGIIMQKFDPTRASSRSRLFVEFINFCEDLRTIKASSHILALRYTYLSYWTEGVEYNCIHYLLRPEVGTRFFCQGSSECNQHFDFSLVLGCEKYILVSSMVAISFSNLTSHFSYCKRSFGNILRDF